MTNGDDQRERTLWCGNLPDTATDELLYELFLQAGPLEKVHIPTDKDSGRQKNFAFITFKHAESVHYTLKLMEGTTLFNRTLRLQSRTGGPPPGPPGPMTPHGHGPTTPHGPVTPPGPGLMNPQLHRSMSAPVVPEFNNMMQGNFAMFRPQVSPLIMGFNPNMQHQQQQLNGGSPGFLMAPQMPHFRPSLPAHLMQGQEQNHQRHSPEENHRERHRDRSPRSRQDSGSHSRDRSRDSDMRRGRDSNRDFDERQDRDVDMRRGGHGQHHERRQGRDDRGSDYNRRRDHSRGHSGDGRNWRN